MDINLQSYIDHCTQKGISKEKIKESLVKAGWKEDTVQSALNVSTPQTKHSINLKMWTMPICLALILLAFTNTYNFLYFGAFTTKSMVEATAGAAAFFIGISFSLSSMSYYFNFLDNKLAYRKEIGLIGYYLAVIYSVLLALTNQDKYVTGFAANLISWDFILGLSAMTILTAMALVSVNKIMIMVTPTVARKILRFGYVAYFLLIVRAVILEQETWLKWFANMDSVPPARILVSAFATFVIILRITMAISIFIKEHKKQNIQPQKIS